jgi:hypothetical protein
MREPPIPTEDWREVEAERRLAEDAALSSLAVQPTCEGSCYWGAPHGGPCPTGPKAEPADATALAGEQENDKRLRRMRGLAMALAGDEQTKHLCEEVLWLIDHHIEEAFETGRAMQSLAEQRNELDYQVIELRKARAVPAAAFVKAVWENVTFGELDREQAIEDVLALLKRVEPVR